MKNVGICGSDVHYWTHGRGARFKVEQKMVLGHEGSGKILKIGADVKNVKEGQGSMDRARKIFHDSFSLKYDC